MTIFLIMIAYILGIIWGLYIKNIALLFCLILIAFLIKIFILNKKKYINIKINKQITTKKIVLFLIVLLISLTYTLILEKSFDYKYKNIEETTRIKAIVVSSAKEKQYNNIYIIKVQEINKNRKYKGTCLLLYLKNKKQKLEYGDEITFQAEYEKADTARNYGGFDYNKYLKTNKIYGIVKAKKIDIIEKENYNKVLMLISKFKNSIIDNCNKILEKDEAALLTGILIGNKDNLSNDIKESFRQSSLSHLLAVSGAHMTYIILAITLLLDKIKIHKKLGKIITILLLVFFTILTGISSSVTRACIMAIYVIIGSLIYRRPNILASISISFLLILIINPYKILDVGLQLSYGGTIGILIFNKNLESTIKKLFNKTNLQILYNPKNRLLLFFSKILKYIKNMFIISVSANLIIFPIIAYHYNTFSLTFFISNILAGPLLGIIIILGFITIIISFVSIKISRIFSYALSIFLKLLIGITNLCSNLPLSKIYVKTPSIFLIFLYYLIIFLFLKRKINLRKINLRNVNFKKILNKKVLAIILIIVLIFQIIKIIPKDLKIYFIDVGQGDSTLIVTPRNKTILIDGGGSENIENYDVGKSIVIPYLLDRGITKLDYIIISHFDSDHVGGLFSVMEELKVKNIIISNQIQTSKNYESFKKIVRENKINVRVVNKADKLQVEKDLYFDILWPNNNNLVTDNVLNNNSIVCKLYYKNFSCLFTGDIEQIAEKQILKEYKNNLNILNSTILKVAHHGSNTSSTEKFLEAVNPKIALVGVGENNKFGHPNDEVIERLEKIKVKIYRTDQMGEIFIRVNSKGKLSIKKFIEQGKKIKICN